MIRKEIISKQHTINAITYLWQSKQISVDEYKILKDKYNID